MTIRFKDWVPSLPAVSSFSASGTEPFPVVQSSASKQSTPATLANWIVGTFAGFLQSGTGAAPRTVQSKMREVVSVTDFYANGVSGVLVDPTGVVDSTLGIQAAIDAGGANSEIFFTDGTFKHTSTITVAQDRVHLIGAGRWATALLFVPTAADTALEFSKGASVLYQCSLSHMTFTSSETTFAKIAVDVVDTSAFTMHDVVVGPLWNGGASGSIGLRTRGREANVYDRIELYCDRPLVIGDNPNSTLDCDQYHFSNLYITCASTSAYPCIEVLTGVNLSDVTFDGYQAWVKGSDGFKWVDTTTVANSQKLTIKNVRWEGTTNATGCLVRIEHNTDLQGLRIESCSGGLNSLGFKLRKVIHATIADSVTENTIGNSLDVDTTVDGLVIQNTYIQSGGAVSLGGLKKLFDAGPGAMPSSSFVFAAFGNQSSVTANRMDVPLMGTTVAIAQDADTAIGTAANLTGFVFVITSEDASAIYALKGATNNTIEVSDPDGFFSPTKDNANTYNIYYEAPSYKIQNKRTGAKDVGWFMLGNAI